MQNNYGNNQPQNQFYSNGQNQWNTQQYYQGNMNQQHTSNQPAYGNQPMMNAQPTYNGQPIYQYQPTPQPQANLPQIRIRNFWGLLAAIVLLISIINSDFIKVIDYGDWTKTFSLSEFCTLLGEDVDVQLFAKLAGFLYILSIATLILMALSAFIDVNTYKKIALIICAVSFAAATILILGNNTGLGDKHSVGTGYIILLAGIALGIKSCFTDNPPKHSLVDSDGVNSSTGEWRCPACDTKNTGSICKCCGRSKKG